MMKVCSILVPSRGPLPILRNMLDSLRQCTAEPERVELVLRFDSNDPVLTERCQVVQETVGIIPTHVIVDKQTSMGVMTVEMIQRSTGRSIWIMNDDVIHETYGWDRLVGEVTWQRPWHAFYPDDNLFSPELACFPLVPLAHAKVTNYYGVERYHRYLIDGILADLYSFTLDRLVYLPQWKIRHLNSRPVTELDLDRWFRRTVSDPTRGYQPVQDGTLEHDQVAYIDHQKEVRQMADAIQAFETVSHARAFTTESEA